MRKKETKKRGTEIETGVGRDKGVETEAGRGKEAKRDKGAETGAKRDKERIKMNMMMMILWRSLLQLLSLV